MRLGAETLASDEAASEGNGSDSLALMEASGIEYPKCAETAEETVESARGAE